MDGRGTDWLSQRAAEVLRVTPDAYQRLVVTGAGSAAAGKLLSELRPQDLLSVSIKSMEDVQAMLAALWLWHDWLEESHRISQSIPSETGSFWHAILHRREGDFSNSKYWYRRCMDHPIQAVVGAQAGPMINSLPADKSIFRLILRGWDPCAFVDLVEQVHADPQLPQASLAISLQQLEWRLLFDHCVREAASAGESR